MANAEQSGRVLAVGLNAVWQKTLVFAGFEPGAVNRAEQVALTPGGKGFHCARAIETLAPGAATLAQFLGGDTGMKVHGAIAALGIRQMTGAIAMPTRVCTTIVDRAANRMTELVEPSPHVEPAAAARLLSDLRTALPGFAGVALCGTCPEGVGPEFYATLAAETTGFVLLDGWKDVTATLDTGKVSLLKLNGRELRDLAGEDEPQAAAAALFDRHDIGAIAVTNGGDPAWFFTPGDCRSLHLPPLADVGNPLGAGDTCTGVTLLECCRGREPLTAFAHGLAAASASCRHLTPAHFDREDQERLLAGIRVASGCRAG